MKKVLWVLAIVVWTLRAFNAFCCECAPIPQAEEALTRSDAAFTGKCTQIEKVNKKDYFGEEMVIVRFDVYENFKGADEKTTELHTVINKSSCNGYWFKEGEEYLVYAYRQKDGGPDPSGLLGTSWCQGTKLLAEAKEEVRQLNHFKAESSAAVDPRLSLFAANQNDPGLIKTDKTVVITTDKSRYGLTENVGVTIKNNTDRDISFFISCGEKPYFYLFKQENTEWKKLAPFPQKKCGRRSYLLKPGEEFTSLLDLHGMYTMGHFVEETVTPGNYKLNIEIQLPGLESVSGAFEVSSNEFVRGSHESAMAPAAAEIRQPYFFHRN